MGPTSLLSTACIIFLATIYSSHAFSATSSFIKPHIVKTSSSSPISGFDYNANDKLPWVSEGCGTWKWQGHDINYLELGNPSKPVLLLIHGFGASLYHFRNNIPVLARDYHVYAFDQLGFGLSSKPVRDYSAELWKNQTLDFVKHVIGKPTTVVGNSIGGLTALYAAACASDQSESLVNGCVLLNAAGQFRDSAAQEVEKEEKNEFVEAISAAIQRAVIGVSFVFTKQPARIEQVLKQVYPVNPDNVDKDLVESIRLPAQDPNAAEVFYRIIKKNESLPLYVDDLLAKLECPLLLCWGEEDPWIRPAAADKIQALYPSCKRVSIEAGHCPHDEAPDAVNKAIREFMIEVHEQ